MSRSARSGKARQDKHRHKSGSMFLSLCASVLFLLGSFLLAFFVFGSKSSVRVLQNVTKGYAVVFTTVAYGFIALSMVPEILLDRIKRPFAHSRYGKLHGTSKSFGMDLFKLNIAQSILFIIASILQAVAFFILFQFENSNKLDEVDLYCKINLAASWFWLFSSALALVTRGCCWFSCLRSAVQTLDQMGNALYIISTVMWMFAALNEYENFANAGLGPNLQDNVMIMWFVAGCAYTVADVLRFCERNPPSSVDNTPLANDDGETELSPAQWTDTSAKKKEPTVRWGPDTDTSDEGSEQVNKQSARGADIESGEEGKESTEGVNADVDKFIQTLETQASPRRHSSRVLASARQEANDKYGNRGFKSAQAPEAPKPSARYSPEIQAVARKKADDHRKELEALTSKRTQSSSIRPDFSGMCNMRQPHPFLPDYDNAASEGAERTSSRTFIRVKDTKTGLSVANVKVKSPRRINPVRETSTAKKQQVQTSPIAVVDFDPFDPCISDNKITPTRHVSGADVASDCSSNGTGSTYSKPML